MSEQHEITWRHVPQTTAEKQDHLYRVVATGQPNYSPTVVEIRTRNGWYWWHLEPLNADDRTVPTMRGLRVDCLEEAMADAKGAVDRLEGCD